MPEQILVVDDEANIALSLQFLMEQAGYAVRTAVDGEAALAAVADVLPALVLLDINMPKKSGYEVCETIRANPDWNGVRIVMLTAKGRDVEREKGLALGADDYLTKPFSTDEVVAKVKALLAPRPVKRISERLIALAVAGALALNYPVLALFDSERLVLGVPALFLYLFFAWAVLIVLAALVLEPRSRGRGNGGERGGPGTS